MPFCSRHLVAHLCTGLRNRLVRRPCASSGPENPNLPEPPPAHAPGRLALLLSGEIISPGRNTAPMMGEDQGSTRSNSGRTPRRRRRDHA